MKEHNEKLEALEQLDGEEARLDAHLRVKGRGRCRPGLKSVNGTCVLKGVPVSASLNDSLSEGLNKLRSRLLNRRGDK